MTKLRACLTIISGVAGMLAASGCRDFLKVENPNFVAATDVNPLADATTLSNSALQNFAASYGTYTAFGGIFTGELYSADVNAPGNLMSVRLVDETATNGYFASMSRSRVLATKVFNSLKGTTGESSINAARAWAVSGYAFLSLAEYFCSATVDGGPELTTAMLLDSAVANLTKASDIGGAVGTAAALQIRNLALVGRARAHLFAGRKPQAIADAAAVSAGFRFDLVFISDLTNIQRLGNYLWYLQFNIGNLSVASDFRNLTDPRMATIAPAVNKLKAMDGVTDMWSLSKYQSYAAPVRLASKIEADYITAEAQGTTAMLALIAARRAANTVPAYTGPVDDKSVLVEFLKQRTYEFFAEGKHMGDYRRYPTDLPFLVATGTPYRKANVPAYSGGRCWPLPIEERTNNPNLHP